MFCKPRGEAPQECEVEGGTETQSHPQGERAPGLCGHPPIKSPGSLTPVLSLRVINIQGKTLLGFIDKGS